MSIEVGASFWQKYIVDVHISEGEDAKQAFYEAKKLIDEFSKEINPGAVLVVNNEYINTDKAPEGYSNSLLEAIEKCTDETELNSFAILATGNEVLKKAFDTKKSQFKKIKYRHANIRN